MAKIIAIERIFLTFINIIKMIYGKQITQLNKVKKSFIKKYNYDLIHYILLYYIIILLYNKEEKYNLY